MSDYSLLIRAHEALKAQYELLLADKRLVQDANAALPHELDQLKAALAKVMPKPTPKAHRNDHDA